MELLVHFEPNAHVPNKAVWNSFIRRIQNWPRSQGCTDEATFWLFMDYSCPSSLPGLVTNKKMQAKNQELVGRSLSLPYGPSLPILSFLLNLFGGRRDPWPLAIRESMAYNQILFFVLGKCSNNQPNAEFCGCLYHSILCVIVILLIQVRSELWVVLSGISNRLHL